MIRRIKGVPVELGPARIGRGTFHPVGPVYLVEGKKITALKSAKKKKRRT